MKIFSCRDCEHCEKKSAKDISQVTEVWYVCKEYGFEIADIGQDPKNYTCDNNTAFDKMKEINFRRI